MEEGQMEDSDNIWQWCKARKRLLTKNQIQAKVNGLCSAAKIGYPIVVLRRHASSSRTYSRPHAVPGPYGEFLHRLLGIFHEDCLEDPNFYDEKEPSKSTVGRSCLDAALKHNRLFSDDGMSGNSSQYAVCNNESSVEDSSSPSIAKVVAEGMELQSPSMNGEMRDFYDKEEPSKSRVGRSCLKAALKHNRLFSDDGMAGNSSQYAACNKEPSVDASSFPSISKDVAEGMELQSPSMNGEMRDLGSKRPYHPPAMKKPKKVRFLIPEISERPFQVEKRKAKSKDLASGLHLLADAAAQFEQN